MSGADRETGWQFLRRLCRELDAAQLAVIALVLTVTAVLAACLGLEAGLHGWHAAVTGAAALGAVACGFLGAISSRRVQHWVESGRWQQ